MGSLGHAVVGLADTASVHHSVQRLADRASLPRWTERAPRRALRRRQRPSSAWPRRWRSSARISTSRCSSSQLIPFVRQCSSNALPWLGLAERACARRWLRRLRKPCKCDSLGHIVAELSRWEPFMSSECVPCAPDRVVMPRWAKRAPRRARRRQQPKSSLPQHWRSSARSLKSRRAAGRACAATGTSAAFALTCFCHLCVQQTAWSRFACHARGSVGNGDGDELQYMEAPVLQIVPCSQSSCA